MAQVTKLTIDSTQVASDLVNFPVYTRLADMPALFWSTVANGGGDIRVYKNNATQTVNTNVLDLEASSSEYATISDASQTGLDFGTGAFSLEAWVKLESTGSFKAIVSKRTGDTDGYSLYINSSDQIIFDCIASSSIDTVTGSTSLSAGVWYHVAGVRDGSNLLVYINGVQDGSGTDNSRNVSTSVNFHIGALRSTPDNYFDGEIADVRAWSDARTPAEIAEYYNQQLAGTETNLVGYWKFDSSLLDETSNNNDLTHSGTATYVADPPYTKAGELPREVVSCDTSTETGELHFKYTGTLSSTVDTEIQIHADGVSSDYAVTDTYGAENVWGTNYKGVWHLQTTSGNATDSTSNSNTLTDNNTVGTGNGKISNGRDFELTNSEYFSISDNASLSITGDISFSGWFKLEQLPSTAGSSMQLLSKDDTSGSRSYAFYIDTNDKLVLLYFDGSSNLTRSISDSAVVAGGDVGSFVYLAGTADVSAQTITLYKNGSAVADTNDFSAASSIRDGTSDFRIGARNVTGSVAEFFDGIIDEPRIYSGILSADWISAEYNNQNTPSTFYTATAPGISFSVSETLSLTESESAIRDRNFTVSETLNLTETVSAILTKLFIVSETLNLTETVSNIRSRVFSVAENLLLNEDSLVQKKWREIVKSVTSWTQNDSENSTTWTESDKSD